MIRRLIISFLACGISVPLAVADTWNPIPGIPSPPFGVIEEPPALPAPWDNETSGFYYVCANCPGSGNRTYGTPSAPRNSLPSNPSSGDVIVLAGQYSSVDYRFSCSANAPCFLLGDPSNPPTISGESSFGGSYYIVDGVHATLGNASGSTLGLSGDHGAFRNGRITGNANYGGAWTDGSYLVLMNNQIVDNGDVNASNDQDRHGVKVYGNNVWIVGNELARNSGDGIQVGDIGTRNGISHIYVGGNVAHDNKQTGIWVKEAQHVIVSSNLSYGHEPSGSSDGEGMGGQYDPQWVWFLFNEIRDNTGGIGFKSSNNGAGRNFYVVGNYIHNNLNPFYSPNDAWTQASVASWNNADLTIVNNTIDGNTGGINLNGNTGSTYIYNNAITNMQHPNAKAIFAADPGDVDFEQANAGDGQQVIDTGVTPPAARNPYQIFAAQYGIEIQVDFDRKSRPIRQWDIGAYESNDEAGPRPKAPVLEQVN